MTKTLRLLSPRRTTHLTLCMLVACHGGGGDGDGGSTTQGDMGSSSTGNNPPASTTSDSMTGDSSGAPSSTTDDASSGDGSTTGPSEPPAPWCGFVGTGPRVLEDAGYDPLPVRNHLGGPTRLALWYYSSGRDRGLRVAVYDELTSAWSDTVELEVAGEVGYLAKPNAAVDADGDALVVTGDVASPAEIRVHRYDASATNWSVSTLPGTLVSARSTEISVDDAGNAVVVAENEYDLGLHSTMIWFYDVASDTWSEPQEIGPIETFGLGVSWAQDRASGDAAFFMDVAPDDLELRHHARTTGEWTTQPVDDMALPSAYPASVVSLGDNRFVAVMASGGFGVNNGQVMAFAYDGANWQPGTSLDSGIDLDRTHVATDRLGRAVITWNAHPTSVRSASYDVASGWAPKQVVNVGQTGADYVAPFTHALDDDGFTVAWSQYHGDAERTYVRHADGDVFGATTEMDPTQPVFSSISSLQAFAAARARVVWARDEGNANYSGWYYACGDAGEWSAPVAIDLRYPRIESGRDGEFLMIGRQDDVVVAEYFVAQ